MGGSDAPIGAIGANGTGAFLPSAPADPSVEPSGPCPACGCGSWVRPPGAGWCCRDCEPASLPPAHEQAEWAFCSVAPDPRPSSPLLMPPAPLPSVVYLDEFLAWTTTAPLGRCRACRFSGPMSERQLCAACELDRLMAATERALSAPDAVADEAEAMLRGDLR